jgi:hypothetical protein
MLLISEPHWSFAFSSKVSAKDNFLMGKWFLAAYTVSKFVSVERIQQLLGSPPLSAAFRNIAETNN